VGVYIETTKICNIYENRRRSTMSKIKIGIIGCGGPLMDS
jgi:hypothetical protein